MEMYPIASKSDGVLTVKFADIPLWNGVQKKPGVNKSLPFELTVADGPIMQSTSSDIIDKVVGAYKVDEYKFITPPPGTSQWANSIGDSKIMSLENIFSNEDHPRNILEIGAGSTWVAKKLYDLYEIDSYVIIDPTVQEEDQKIEIIREYFPHQKIAGRRFDLIVGFSVLEHVTDPVLFLNNIKEYLTEDGTVVLVFPDCESQLISGDINVFIHEHLSYFTESSSQWLAATCGFAVKYLESENDCFTIELQLNSMSNDHKLIINESDILINSVDKFRYLFNNIKDRVTRCLDSGLKVGFHGATNGLNTFLYVTKLGGNLNIKIYDGDTSKQGLYLPVCESPIMSPLDKSYLENDLMVISAMSFYSQIIDFATNEVGLKEEQILPLVGLECL